MDIIAIKQDDDITVIKAVGFDIRVEKQIDSITIRDIEDVISGSSNLVFEIIAMKKEDNILITRSPATNITVID